MTPTQANKSKVAFLEAYSKNISSETDLLELMRVGFKMSVVMWQA